MDMMFLCVFTAELVLQLIYRLLKFFTDSWLIFDFVIVVSSWSLESLQVFRAFRIFRALRLITRIGTLRDLINAIAQVMPRMSAIAALLSLIFYIFGVLFTELFGELDLSTNYFGTLDLSLFTCMQMMTMEWADICREVMVIIPWAWLPFLVFIMFTGFVVFNLIVAVVCDAVKLIDAENKAANKTPEELARERQVMQVEGLYKNVASMKENQAQIEGAIEGLMKQIIEMDQDMIKLRQKKARSVR
jgi:hypothetical protein